MIASLSLIASAMLQQRIGRMRRPRRSRCLRRRASATSATSASGVALCDDVEEELLLQESAGRVVVRDRQLGARHAIVGRRNIEQRQRRQAILADLARHQQIGFSGRSDQRRCLASAGVGCGESPPAPAVLRRAAASRGRCCRGAHAPAMHGRQGERSKRSMYNSPRRGSPSVQSVEAKYTDRADRSPDPVETLIICPPGGPSGNADLPGIL